MVSDIHHSKSKLNHTTMKHIILILLLPIFLTAQKDTTTNLLMVYSDIEATDLGSTYRVKFTSSTRNLSSYTIIDTTALDLTTYIDSIIADVQQDSIAFQIVLEQYYTRYKEQNTYFQNAKRFLAKLWAIRP